MILVGTVANAEDETSRIQASGDNYDLALEQLRLQVPDGTKLISIRVER
ncbi:hypothetical protein [Arthrobacter sp. A2-55]|nr:hypothetical protein [Arthrobacter sp. A2-55]MCU6481301.1 hypothetical protein [Arthrobacter sp. A2-55]